ncbi:MAG: glycosyltransferase [candidate division Zixibacteria bacterium]|nr:glycosyltransferase [candidate division Zixibacteria bacterium]
MLFILASFVVLNLLYAIGIIYLYIGMNKARKSNMATVEDDNLLPEVTVIIPARDESSNIAGIIEDLKTQDYPEGKCFFTIIDDFSSDDTYRKAMELIGGDERFRLFRLAEDDEYLASTNLSAKKRVVDFGVKNADTEIVLFTDADCRMGRRWVRSMASQFQDQNSITAGFVGYRYNSLFKAVLALEALANRIIASGAIGWGEAVTCAAANWGYRKSLYNRLGGLEKFADSLSGDDTLFLQTAVKNGARAVYNFNPDSFVYTTESGGLGEVIMRRIRRLGIARSFNWNIMLFSALLLYYGWLMVAVVPFLSVSDPYWLYILIAGWMFKWIFEFWIIAKGAGLFRSRNLIKFTPLASVYHALVITIVGTASLIFRGSWKGRAI